MEQITILTENPFLASILQLFLNPTPYFLGVVFILLIIFFYGVKTGKGRLILNLLSLYVAIVLTILFPYRNYLLEKTSISEPYFIELGLFIVAFFLVLILFVNSPLRNLAIKSRGHIFQVLLLSILILGVFVSHITVLLPAEILAKLDHPVFTYFKTEIAQFWWALAGVVGLAVLRRKGE